MVNFRNIAPGGQFTGTESFGFGICVNDGDVGRLGEEIGETGQKVRVAAVRRVADAAPESPTCRLPSLMIIQSLGAGRRLGCQAHMCV